MNKRNRAVFLDRDGTILNERGYLADPAKMFFYPSAFKALRRLKAAGYRLIVVTNQSGIGRGYFDLAAFQRVNRAFLKTLAAKGVRIDAVYFCPHHPTAGCSCRKPNTRLALTAARRFGLDLKGSFVVGDQAGDIHLARNIGARGVLVLTGAGRSLRPKLAPHASKVTRNLATAVNWILSHP